MSKSITFRPPNGDEVELEDQVFVFDGKERNVSAVEQAVLIKIVCPEGIAEKLPQRRLRR